MSRSPARWILALAAPALATACGLPDGDYFGPVPAVREPHHLRWCNAGQPESLDPGQAQSTIATPLVHALFDGLTIYGDDGQPEPSLATTWEIAPDQRRVTFHLRPDGRFSNGRPVTAHDIAYQALRTLQPQTASPSSDGLDFIKGYDSYTNGTGKVLLHDVGGLPAGTIVDVVGAGGKPLADWSKAHRTPPDSNVREATRPLALRDLGAAPADAYATVPAGDEVTIIELSGRPASLPDPDGRAWAYVWWNHDDGLYGWVPAAELDVEPHAADAYDVKPVPRRQVPGLDAPLDELEADARVERAAVSVRGSDILTLPEIVGVRVPDPLTFVIEAAKPTPYIVMTTPSRVLRAVPREAVSRRPRRWAEPGTIVTSGPMHLVAMKERNYLELVRSPTFWNQASVKLDRLTVLSIDNQAAAANLYYTGACDAVVANNVPASYLPLLTGETRGGRSFRDFSISPYLGSYFLMFNTEKLANVHLRRALVLAIDRSQIPKVLHGGEIPSASYVPGTPIADLGPDERALCGVSAGDPGLALIVERGKLCYVPPRGLDYDPDRARAELAIARREMGASFPKTLVYKFNVGVESHVITAELVQAQWKQVLGLDVELESQEWQVFLSATRIGEFEVARLGWVGSAPSPESEFMGIWRCSSPNNRSRWCNPQYEALMDEAASMTDPAARLRKIAEAETVLLDDAPLLPLYAYTQKNLQRPYVRGLPQNYIAQPPLWKAWLDPDWKQAR
ncbi:MAG TPA: peptide ABC transporter substrate-binding protein [Kofleriaceae bacterium]|nr:peptide ABC transporter substrate-binding protein [Kofleriaceae bacterium]